jgi:hypothetical protein
MNRHRQAPNSRLLTDALGLRLRRAPRAAKLERSASAAHRLNPAAYLRRGGEQLEATKVRTEAL